MTRPTLGSWDTGASLTVVDPTFAQANPEILDEIGELESGADPFGQAVASP